MNVLFLSEQLYPHGGGAELATYLYAKLLSQNGIKIKVITNRFPGEKDVTRSGNMEIFRLHLFDRPTALKYSLSLKFPLLFSSFLHRLIRWSDVVYIPLYWYSAIPLAKAYRKPVVIHLHNYLLSCPLATLYNFAENSICSRKRRFICPTNCIFSFEKISGRRPKEILLSTMLNSMGRNYIEWLASMGDALICVSNAQKRLIMQTCEKIFWRKFHVVYNPLPEVSYVKIDGEDFGYFGGLNFLKGFEVLRNAMVYLKDHAVRVHVAGSSSTPETMMRELSSIGMILHKRLNKNEQELLYRQIKGVIFPSIIPEPLPYVTAEAMLRGRVLIASRIGGIPEQTKNCKGVFLFDVGNYHELAELIKYVNSLNREVVSDLGHKNREVFTKTFNNEKTVAKFMDILDHLNE